MEYETFKEIVESTFVEYLPEKHQAMEIKIIPVTKVNITADGLTLDNGTNIIFPTIYINDMYNEYKEINDIKEVIQSSVDRMVKFMENIPYVGALLNIDHVKENITFQLINTEHNKKLLNESPNRKFHDLSVIYRWVVGECEDGVQSTIINNSVAGCLGLLEDQLFVLAMENTRRLFPTVVLNINDIMRDIYIRNGMSEKLIDVLLEDVLGNFMWAFTNSAKINGATVMLYEDELYQLAENLKADLYIMPSSVHEVIVVPTSIGDPNDLAEMVAQVNIAEVELKDRLSNQVYHYDRNLRKLKLATDTSNKRLDNKY